MGGHFPRRLFIKRGVFYFERRIPKVLQARYGRQRVRLCLHTSNEAEARKTANIISMQLEIAWNQARLEAMGLLTISALAPLGEATNASASQPTTVKLSDAHEIYVRLRGKGKGKIFLGSAERHFAPHRVRETSPFQSFCIEPYVGRAGLVWLMMFWQGACPTTTRPSRPSRRSSCSLSGDPRRR